MRFCLRPWPAFVTLYSVEFLQEDTRLWHAACVQIAYQVSSGILKNILSVIPEFIPDEAKRRPQDFTRERKLSLRRLIVTILHLVAAGKPGGVDIQTGLFFKNARRAGLWPEARAVHRSALSRRRALLDWTVFRDILRKAVKMAYDLWPERAGERWRGMHVLAIDGSKYTLPASATLRAAFDPSSGLQYPGKGHYPQCLVSTLYDVFRRLPVARSVAAHDGSERREALGLLAEAPRDSWIIFDRGYPGYDFLSSLTHDFEGHYLMRCQASKTFGAVQRFLAGGSAEELLEIAPSSKTLQRTPREQRPALPNLRLRAIRMVAPDGTVSALLTDLTEPASGEFVELYRRRWAVETAYRDEKKELDIEIFHGRTPNSVRQELFAVLIVTVIARLLSALLDERDDGAGECQLKNACVALAHDAAVLAPNNPAAAAAVLEELLEQIARVQYYRHKKPRPSQPRITRRAVNRWIMARAQSGAP